MWYSQWCPDPKCYRTDHSKVIPDSNGTIPIFDRFGAIDILINNASAIQLSDTLSLDMKRYDLMNQINVRGTFAMSKACIPHLMKSKNPHILNMSPPLSMKPHWFAGHTAYTMSKYGMSMVAMGLSAELEDKVLIPLIAYFSLIWISGNCCKCFVA